MAPTGPNLFQRGCSLQLDSPASLGEVERRPPFRGMSHLRRSWDRRHVSVRTTMSLAAPVSPAQLDARVVHPADADPHDRDSEAEIQRLQRRIVGVAYDCYLDDEPDQ